MTAEVWAQIRSALETALTLRAGDRDDFLKELARQDPRLHSEVEDLLALEPQATELFSIDRWQDRASGMASGVEPGMLVGHYRLLRELGHGGMGTVYLAERADGEYQHQVAVKLLQPSVQVPGMAERFRQERQILARLSHPGIARLLDGGVTQSGLLYAVMEYVEGEPIDLYCDRHGLSVPERLRLFLKAAEAVQYAHQQLVLHLDIKPANLLVTPDGEPRLLDFGISRIMAESERLAVQGETTLRLLTPRYASPEQASGEPLSVASDVFSLGTLLYRLLTGRLPYPIDDAAPLEAARMIRDVPPQIPSRVAPPERRTQLSGDLDLILLHALRKEPERRYATVAALAEDLGHYLALRPVGVHRDSVPYRVARFVRRRRGAVAASALVLLVIAVSVGMIIRSAIIARREEAVATRRLQDVRDLAHSYIFDLDPQLQGIPGTVGVRSFILHTGMKYLDAMAKEAGTDDALNNELALGYLRLSVLENSFVYQSLGNKEEARAALNKAIALVSAAYQRNPHDPAQIEQYLYIREEEGITAEAQGDIERYDSILERLWTLGQPLLTAKNHPQGLFDMGSIAAEMATNRIGNGALWNFADPIAGLQCAKRSEAIMARLQSEYPSSPLAKRAMVDAMYDRATEIDGNTELGNEAGVSAALAELERRASATAFQQDPRLAPARRIASDYILATLVLEHRLAEADAAAPQDRVTDMPEKENNSRLKLADATFYRNSGWLDLEKGRVAAGTRKMEQALRIYEDLLRADPADVNATVQIIYTGTRLGLEPLAPSSVRREALQRVIDLSSRYAASHPRIASPQAVLALAWITLESMDRDEGKMLQARDEAEQARISIQRLRSLAPQSPMADRLASQLKAVDSGKLDHQNACRQRVGAMFFMTFLNGEQQMAACAISSVRSTGAVHEPARVGPRPSPDGR
ncbi:MAG: serine/threonine-protein kinase [Acidobacteriota bacterium]